MKDQHLLAPCGLYCGACSDYSIDNECQGCGSDCSCGNCAVCWHHDHCQVYTCVKAHGFQTCAECPDLPCSTLIGFAYDPIWRSHLPVIENLRRIRKIGAEAWLEEQRSYWDDLERRLRQNYSLAEYSARYAEYHNKRKAINDKKD